MDTGFVYVLQCSNGRYYVGSTNDVVRRFKQHSLGQCLSTKNILPVQLLCYYKCPTLTEARRLEYSLKKQKSRKVIEKFIADNLC